jgi:hypothetical protein
MARPSRGLAGPLGADRRAPNEWSEGISLQPARLGRVAGIARRYRIPPTAARKPYWDSRMVAPDSRPPEAP